MRRLGIIAENDSRIEDPLTWTLRGVSFRDVDVKELRHLAMHDALLHGFLQRLHGAAHSGSDVATGTVLTQLMKAFVERCHDLEELGARRLEREAHPVISISFVELPRVGGPLHQELPRVRDDSVDALRFTMQAMFDADPFCPCHGRASRPIYVAGLFCLCLEHCEP